MKEKYDPNYGKGTIVFFSSMILGFGTLALILYIIKYFFPLVSFETYAMLFFGTILFGLLLVLGWEHLLLKIFNMEYA